MRVLVLVFQNILKYFCGGRMKNQIDLWDQMVSMRDVDDWKNESFEYHQDGGEGQGCYNNQLTQMRKELEGRNLALINVEESPLSSPREESFWLGAQPERRTFQAFNIEDNKEAAQIVDWSYFGREKTLFDVAEILLEKDSAKSDISRKQQLYLMERTSVKEEEPAKETHEKASVEKSPEKNEKNNVEHGGQEDYRVRDTKNLVKNIFRLFTSWLEEHTPPELSLTTEAESMLLNNNRKYNNRLVIQISKHAKLRRAFLTFSENQGEDLINESRINDRSSHLQALRKYRSFCQEESSLENQQEQRSLLKKLPSNSMKRSREEKRKKFM